MMAFGHHSHDINFWWPVLVDDEFLVVINFSDDYDYYGFKSCVDICDHYIYW